MSINRFLITAIISAAVAPFILLFAAGCQGSSGTTVANIPQSSAGGRFMLGIDVLQSKGFDLLRWRVVGDSQFGIPSPVLPSAEIIDIGADQVGVGDCDLRVVESPDASTTDSHLFDRAFDILDQNPIAHCERTVDKDRQ